MSDFQREINERIDAFVQEITELAKKAAQETLESALGSVRRSGGKSGAVATAPRARRKSGKRSPEEIAETADTLLAHIREKPGERMESIAKALGTTTKDLTLPTKKLLAQNLIRVEGQKRATSYYPASGRSRSATRKRGKRRSKK